MWHFWTYRSLSSRDDVLDWLDGLAKSDQASVVARLEYLRQQPREAWKRPYFDLLSGECSGLGEVRLKIQKIQYRPIGFFGPNRLEFTMLHVALEKDGKFEPKNVCKTAKQRMADAIDDPRLLNEWPY